MRAFVSFLAGLVAVLALTAALPFAWLAVNVADEDGYVDFTSAIAADPQFRDDVVQVVADGVADEAPVPAGLKSTVRDAVASAAGQVVDTPAFLEVFEQTQRASHRATFGTSADPAADQVVIDLAPVAAEVVDSLAGGLPVDVPAPEQLRVTVGGGDQRAAIDAVTASTDRATVLAVIAAGAALLSLVAARRRSVAMAWLGAGAVLSAGVAALGVRETLPSLLSTDGGGQVGDRLQQLLVDAAISSFDAWAVVVAATGAALVVVGAVARGVSGR